MYLKTFAQRLDTHYQDTMMDCVGYLHVCDELLPERLVTKSYDNMRATFPFAHLVLGKIVSSK